MHLNGRGYTLAAWVGIALLAVALVYVAIMGSWFGALLLAAFLAASVAFVMTKPLPSLFNLLFVAAAVLNAAGWVWNLYPKITGYDEVAHFFTSFAVTLSLGFLVYRNVRQPSGTTGGITCSSSRASASRSAPSGRSSNGLPCARCRTRWSTSSRTALTRHRGGRVRRLGTGPGAAGAKITVLIAGSAHMLRAQACDRRAE